MADHILQPLYDTAAAERRRRMAAWKATLAGNPDKAPMARRDEAIWRGIEATIAREANHPAMAGKAPPADLAPHIASVDATARAFMGKPETVETAKRLLALRNWLTSVVGWRQATAEFRARMRGADSK